MSPIEAFLNEASWVWIFEELYRQTGNIDVAFTVVTSTAVLLTSFYVLKKTRGFVHLIFFMNPGFINLVAEQLRSGLASGLFYTALWIRNYWIKGALLLLASSIHTSFVLLSVFYIGFHVFRRMGPMDLTIFKPYTTMAIVITASIVLTLFRDVLLASIGDERAYFVVDYQSGILLSLGFLSFSATHMAFTKEKVVTFESAFYLFNVVMAMVSAIVGVYGGRFVAVALPALAVMASQLPLERRVPFFIQYVAFSVGYFFYWMV
jgi:hypothetical protein